MFRDDYIAICTRQIFTRSPNPRRQGSQSLWISSSPPKTNAARQILAAKCQSLVNELSKAWAEEGVIERKACAWRKNAQFQTLWDAEVAKLERSKAFVEQTSSDLDLGESLEMSRRNSASINRGLLEDNISAKVKSQGLHPSFADHCVENCRRGTQVRGAIKARTTQLFALCTG